VPVNLDAEADAASAIAAATALTRGTRIEVFHSLAVRDAVTLRAADVEVNPYRRRNAGRARARISELIGTVPGAGFSAAPSIEFGYPSSMVLAREQAMRADLVVIGKRPRGAIADFLLGSVAQRVLAGSRSDVLVLPTVAKAVGESLVPRRLPA
jgi:nucleotide-binding universal stress UspA family protein